MWKEIKFRLGDIVGLKCGKRPYIYRNTDHSPKWKQGHNVGCCFHAPDDICICQEFEDDNSRNWNTSRN